MRRLFITCVYSLFLMFGIGISFAQDSPGSIILDQAQSYLLASEYDKALEIYSFYLRSQPESLDALSQRAVVYASLDDFSSAFNDINTAFDIAGFSAIEQAMIYNSRGQVYYLEGNDELSLQDFSRAIDLHSTVADYWLDRAVWYQVVGDWDNALADYQQYATLQPNNSEAYLNIARVHLVLDDLEATIEALDSAIAIKPDDPELYIFRGSINLRHKQVAAAAVDYSNWLQMINVNIIEQDLLVDDTTQLVLDMSYGVVHHISFEANSGDRLGIAANSLGVDSLVILLDPDGNPIMADDDGGQGLNSFFVDFGLPDDGMYTLWVGHARGGWNGEIELTVQVVPSEGV
jgi:tetratricopeptide (TPR) repeat protein